MPIRVYCDCGRKLIVSDDQAGRKTSCPVCGGVVKVPKRGAGKTSREPVLKEKFITGGRSDHDADGKPDAIDRQVTIGSHTASPEGTTPKKPRRPRIVWHESVWIPFDHLRFVLGLSFAGALAAAFFTRILQADLERTTLAAVLRIFGGSLVTVLLTVGVACNFLGHVLAEASRADRAPRRWVTLQIEESALALGRFVLCFLAGPSLPAGFALWYWIGCGEVDWLDRVILFEALALAGGYFAFQALLTSRRPLAGLLPVPVISTAWKLGWRSAVIALGMGLALGGVLTMAVPAMIASSRGLHWTAFRLWFMIHLLAVTAFGILFDLLGGWHARFVAEPTEDSKPATKPKSVVKTIALPEPLPESSSF